jgi:ABC-type nitrate/sulfonate/bicarbonate transport system substrate-binding protein
MKRSAFLAASTSFLASRTLAEERSPIKVGAGLIEQQAEAYYARELGLFEKHGLTVQVQTLRSGAAIAAAVAGGELQVGVSNVVQLAQAHQRGLPFVVIALGAIHDSRYSTSGLCVAAASPITSPRELGGKTVAVATLNGLDQLAASVLIDKSGGDSSTVKFIEFTPAAAVEAIAQGKIDAANLEDPELSAGIEAKKIKKIGDGEDAIGKRWVGTAWFTTAAWLGKNKDAARRFAAAIYEAGAWAMSNPERAAAILQKSLGMKEARAENRFATKTNLVELQTVLDVAARYKYVPQTSAVVLLWNGT